MKTIADVIAELTTAAEEVSTLSEGEKLRLLDRAYVTIKEGWELVGEPARIRESSEALDIIQAGGIPLHLHDDEMKAILLEGVMVIRQIEKEMSVKEAEASQKHVRWRRGRRMGLPITPNRSLCPRLLLQPVDHRR